MDCEGLSYKCLIVRYFTDGESKIKRCSWPSYALDPNSPAFNCKVLPWPQIQSKYLRTQKKLDYDVIMRPGTCIWQVFASFASLLIDSPLLPCPHCLQGWGLWGREWHKSHPVFKPGAPNCALWWYGYTWAKVQTLSTFIVLNCRPISMILAGM